MRLYQAIPDYSCFLPDEQDKKDADYLFEKYKDTIEGLNVDNQECFFGTIYIDRQGIKKVIVSTILDTFMGKISRVVDARDIDGLTLIVFQDPQGSRAFYLYEEAINIMNGNKLHWDALKQKLGMR